jgi:separase
MGQEMECLEANTAALSVMEPTAQQQDYDKLKIVELRALSKQRGLPSVGRKLDIIGRLRALDDADAIAVTNAQTGIVYACGAAAEAVTSGHVVLVLDESLQPFPFEALPSLRHISCSRCPSLPLLLSMLDSHPRRKQQKEQEREMVLRVNARQCWYAVDIDSNLSQTRQAMEAFLQDYITYLDWQGCVGHCPSPELVAQLSSYGEVFIYSGHGAGDKIFSMPDLLQHRAAFLWGCSSGKLRRQGIFDPTGPALRHLIAGVAMLAANLWDVTDKDLDKLSIACMQIAFKHVVRGDEEEVKRDRDAVSVAEALRRAREVCKMKYAVASAAIIYGLPLIAHVDRSAEVI